MQGIYKHYIIDMSCNNNFVQVPAVQGDGNNVRGFEVELIANNIQYVVDASTTYVCIAGTKPDTKQILNDCVITSEGYILVDITQQMAAVAGRGDYSIVLMDLSTNSQLKSFPFYILVTPSAYNASDVISSNEFQTLTKGIANLNRIKNEVEKLEEEVKENENNRVIAEEERIDAEEIRKSNEIIRIDNENERIESEKNRNESESQRIIKENERNDAEKIRISNENERIDAEKIRQDNEKKRLDAEDKREQSETDRNDAEKNRCDEEAIRQSNEKKRQEQESQRQIDTATAIANTNTATQNAITATDRANTISADLEEKVATGYYKGEPGKDGVITTVNINQIAFQVVGDNLFITYEEGNTDAQKFSINDEGHMIYTLSA